MWLLTTFLPEVLGETTRSECVFFTSLVVLVQRPSIYASMYNTLLNCFGNILYSEFFFCTQGPHFIVSPQGPEYVCTGPGSGWLVATLNGGGGETSGKDTQLVSHLPDGSLLVPSLFSL